ncbi:serine--tRNA ligase [candidate division WWE3 bacterium CG08_land_8_20_14_0_20_43_13]|uniref:Serine--tRNA ligase n=1 Tax=candidate division WWE3 bacterium CG08_land_8_20_14_0_20_43_13 TaxID=1975087 RepID=A0A2H0X8I4_UNCKA|nr:MAG: serine--tRNA ligase [candidate division WWE3 bacterium CG08_land_8_20_14_0_20_43_13]
MLDLKFVRENKELVENLCARRGSPAKISEILELDANRLVMLKKCEILRAERNQLTLGAKGGKPSDSDLERGKELKIELSALEQELGLLERHIKEKLLWLPNLLADDVPEGTGGEDNVEFKKWGSLPEFSFSVKDHQELGENLDIIDLARAAKVAGSRYYYLKGDGALLTWALHFWATKVLVSRGFTPFFTPGVAKENTLFGTGYLPFNDVSMYKIEDENYSLIGTSEQTLIGYHADEVLDLSSGPLKYTAFSPCFRKESGSYGKDTRGIFRVHQFHKVEQVIFCLPQDSPRYYEECLANEEYFLQQLEIPYRVVKACVGDMGFPGYKKYDIEAWFPAQDRYREVTSNTNLTDFQARRLNIRAKIKDDLVYAHTISATGVTDRFIAAILENYQQEDGSITIPKVLRDFVGKDLIAHATTAN